MTLTITDIVAQHGVSEATIRRALRAGDLVPLAALSEAAGKYVFAPEAVQAWAAKRKPAMRYLPKEQPQ